MRVKIYIRTMLLLFVLVLAACRAAAEAVDATTPNEPEPTAVPSATAVLPTNTVQPQPTDTPEPAPTDSPEPAPTQTPEPTAEVETSEDPTPLFAIGATASWTESNDVLGIEGEIEYISATEIVIRDFLFLASEAPGVDIRLGIDDDFTDGVGVSLKDITGKTYEGRSFTLTIPAEGFDGRSFNSIGVFCFDTGDLFDWALLEAP